MIPTICRFLCLIALIAAFSCCQRADDIITDSSAQLTFDQDTVFFDTIFVTRSSATKWLTVYNTHDQKINISSIRLAGGDDSPYRLNIDGVKSNDQKDIEIWADDSLHIFIETTLDPSEGTTPFVVTDSILFETNGNLQDVDLVAWGQDAHFYGVGTPNGVDICDQVWTNEKPYVIYDGIVVRPDCNLTIEAGTKVHLHNGAILFVQGTLTVNGGTDSTDIVTFQGTRLEYDAYYVPDGYYQEIPAQWGWIHFLPGSVNNYINGALIQNSTYGLIVDSYDWLDPQNTNPTQLTALANLTLSNTTIRDFYTGGLWGIGSDISAVNCAVFNSSGTNFQVNWGGNYQFLNCTFANQTVRYNEHKQPIITFADHLAYGSEDVRGNENDLLKVDFINCIIYGGEDEQLSYNHYFTPEDGSDFTVNYINCLLKTEISTDTVGTSSILNPAFSDTMFVDYRARDLRLNGSSPCVNAGLSDIPISAPNGEMLSSENDLSGKARDAEWDIGAYEF